MSLFDISELSIPRKLSTALIGHDGTDFNIAKVLPSGELVTTTNDLAQVETFARIRAGQFKDNEEVRYAAPSSYLNTQSYIGVAITGTPTTSAEWAIIRKDYDALGNVFRERFRLNVSWDDRALGWT